MQAARPPDVAPQMMAAPGSCRSAASIAAPPSGRRGLCHQPQPGQRAAIGQLHRPPFLGGAGGQHGSPLTGRLESQDASLTHPKATGARGLRRAVHFGEAAQCLTMTNLPFLRCIIHPDLQTIQLFEVEGALEV